MDGKNESGRVFAKWKLSGKGEPGGSIINDNAEMRPFRRQDEIPRDQ